MSKNTSNVDRIVRLVLAVAFFVGAGVVGFGTIFGIILAVLGVVMVVTAAIGFCPLYRLFGLRTNNTPTTK
jgi:hypothetical protein